MERTFASRQKKLGTSVATIPKRRPLPLRLKSPVVSDRDIAIRFRNVSYPTINIILIDPLPLVAPGDDAEQNRFSERCRIVKLRARFSLASKDSLDPHVVVVHFPRQAWLDEFVVGRLWEKARPGNVPEQHGATFAHQNGALLRQFLVFRQAEIALVLRRAVGTFIPGPLEIRGRPRARLEAVVH